VPLSLGLLLRAARTPLLCGPVLLILIVTGVEWFMSKQYAGLGRFPPDAAQTASAHDRAQAARRSELMALRQIEQDIAAAESGLHAATQAQAAATRAEAAVNQLDPQAVQAVAEQVKKTRAVARTAAQTLDWLRGEQAARNAKVVRIAQAETPPPPDAAPWLAENWLRLCFIILAMAGLVALPATETCMAWRLFPAAQRLAARAAVFMLNLQLWFILPFAATLLLAAGGLLLQTSQAMLGVGARAGALLQVLKGGLLGVGGMLISLTTLAGGVRFLWRHQEYAAFLLVWHLRRTGVLDR
jgi:hypothetical protein